MQWPIQDCWYQSSLPLNLLYSVPQLAGHQQTRVVIIGAGFAGLATALGLVERGVQDIVILEAETLGYGASGRNGGFIMAGYSLPEKKLIQSLGEAAACELYQLTMAAQAKIKQRVRKYQIDCDLVDEGIVLADWFKKEKAMQQQALFMQEKMRTDWQFLAPHEMQKYVNSECYGCGLLEPNGAHFQPMSYVRGLAKHLMEQGVKIYEHSRATSVEQKTQGWSIRAESTVGESVIQTEQVIVCAGGYIKGLPVKAAQSVLPVATFVMATEPIGKQLLQHLPGQAAIYDNRFAFDYYRALSDTRILWGGRIAINKPSSSHIEQLLKRDLVKVFPALADIKVQTAWGGLMGYTRSQMPSIVESAPGLWHTLGFGGHGVCATTIAGELVAAAITDEHQQYLQFRRFQLSPVYGWLGLLAAQGYYWARQLRDILRL